MKNERDLPIPDHVAEAGKRMITFRGRFCHTTLSQNRHKDAVENGIWSENRSKGAYYEMVANEMKTDLHESTLYNCANLVDRIPDVSMRAEKTGLGVGHYLELGRVRESEGEERFEELEQQASENEWTRDRLRDEIRPSAPDVPGVAMAAEATHEFSFICSDHIHNKTSMSHLPAWCTNRRMGRGSWRSLRGIRGFVPRHRNPIAVRMRLRMIDRGRLRTLPRPGFCRIIWDR